MRDKFLGYSLVALFTVWAVCAALGVAGQRKLFYEQGKEELSDFWMPRMCLEQGYIVHPEKYAGFVGVWRGEQVDVGARDVEWSDWYTNGEETIFITGWRDKVYPMFALLPFKAFPAPDFKSEGVMRIATFLGATSMGVDLVHPLFTRSLSIAITCLVPTPYGILPVLGEWLLVYLISLCVTATVCRIKCLSRFVQ